MRRECIPCRHTILATLLAVCTAWGVAAVAPAQAADAAPAKPAAATSDDDSCIRCHRDPDFLVTHPKLYQYFRDWEGSIHREEGVTCSDCHGGNPAASTREAAHAGMQAESSPDSAVNYANVPRTCGSCHGDVEEAYLKSKHAKHLTRASRAKSVAPDDEKQGPSCVTCHSSMNTLTLDVTTVEATCARCHGKDNHPEIPDEARNVLNRFLSIDRFHRYVAVRLDPAEGREFLEGVDRQRQELSVLWHTFDLKAIDARTQTILDELRRKRDEIRARAHAGQSSQPSQGGRGGADGGATDR